MNQKSRTTAFVLSGGASLGAIQAGVLEALFERGITPDLIVGTSAGALGFLDARDHLLPASELRRLMRKHATVERLEQTSVALHVIATDDGRQLTDGGVSNNVPLSHALELGADQIYVLPTGAPCEVKELPRGALPMLLYTTGLLIR